MGKFTKYPEGLIADKLSVTKITVGVENQTRTVAIPELQDSMLSRRQQVDKKVNGYEISEEQREHIRNGTFKGMPLGSRWMLNGYETILLDYNYYQGITSGNDVIGANHIVLAIKNGAGPCTMWPGGHVYPGENVSISDKPGFYQTYLCSWCQGRNPADSVDIMLKETFGRDDLDSIILKPDDWVSTRWEMSNYGCPADITRINMRAHPMNSIMVYGSRLYAPVSHNDFIPAVASTDDLQLAYFRIGGREAIRDVLPNGGWLKDQVGANHFQCINDNSAGNPLSSGWDNGSTATKRYPFVFAYYVA